ncbi:hypothetical protein Syun_002389 [Stephania yunnanensis]|uniref:Uncharacterized protein n=1 Tax=Stephania yunnanensis TaxID=152371 RepID=A0AAP0LJM0_9MAGN
MVEIHHRGIKISKYSHVQVLLKGRQSEILGNYEAAKVGFGTGKNMKTSIARAVYDCPFVDGGIKSVALSVGDWFFDRVGVKPIWFEQTSERNPEIISRIDHLKAKQAPKEDWP